MKKKSFQKSHEKHRDVPKHNRTIFVLRFAFTDNASLYTKIELSFILLYAFTSPGIFWGHYLQKNKNGRLIKKKSLIFLAQMQLENWRTSILKHLLAYFLLFWSKPIISMALASFWYILSQNWPKIGIFWYSLKSSTKRHYRRIAFFRYLYLWQSVTQEWTKKAQNTTKWP